MELRLKNKTEFPQQIMLVDGSGITVLSSEVKEISLNDVFSEELVRLKGFFDIEEIPEAKKKTPDTSEYKVETKIKDGGTE